MVFAKPHESPKVSYQPNRFMFGLHRSIDVQINDLDVATTLSLPPGPIASEHLSGVDEFRIFV